MGQDYKDLKEDQEGVFPVFLKEKIYSSICGVLYILQPRCHLN